MHESLVEGSTIVQGLFLLSNEETASVAKMFPTAPMVAMVSIARKHRSQPFHYGHLGTQFPEALELVLEKQPDFTEDAGLQLRMKVSAFS
jgi:hypothetical protein